MFGHRYYPYTFPAEGQYGSAEPDLLLPKRQCHPFQSPSSVPVGLQPWTAEPHSDVQGIWPEAAPLPWAWSTQAGSLPEGCRSEGPTWNPAGVSYIPRSQSRQPRRFSRAHPALVMLDNDDDVFTAARPVTSESRGAAQPAWYAAASRPSNARPPQDKANRVLHLAPGNTRGVAPSGSHPQLPHWAISDGGQSPAAHVRYPPRTAAAADHLPAETEYFFSPTAITNSRSSDTDDDSQNTPDTPRPVRIPVLECQLGSPANVAVRASAQPVQIHAQPARVQAAQHPKQHQDSVQTTRDGLASNTQRMEPLSSRGNSHRLGQATKPAVASGKDTATAQSKCSAAVHGSISRSQAARVIQRCWRGWRVRKHSCNLKVLMRVNRDLSAAASKFYQHLGSTAGNLTHKQMLEVTELAMKAILQLDSLPSLPLEYRPLRKRLMQRCLELQDQAQAAYAASTAKVPSRAPSLAPGQLAAAANIFKASAAGSSPRTEHAVEAGADSSVGATASLSSSSGSSDTIITGSGSSTEATASHTSHEVSLSDGSIAAASCSSSPEDMEHAACTLCEASTRKMPTVVVADANMPADLAEDGALVPGTGALTVPCLMPADDTLPSSDDGQQSTSDDSIPTAEHEDVLATDSLSGSRRSDSLMTESDANAPACVDSLLGQIDASMCDQQVTDDQLAVSQDMQPPVQPAEDERSLTQQVMHIAQRMEAVEQLLTRLMKLTTRQAARTRGHRVQFKPKRQHIQLPQRTSQASADQEQSASTATMAGDANAKTAVTGTGLPVGSSDASAPVKVVLMLRGRPGVDQCIQTDEAQDAM